MRHWVLGGEAGLKPSHCFILRHLRTGQAYRRRHRFLIAFATSFDQRSFHKLSVTLALSAWRNEAAHFLHTLGHAAMNPARAINRVKAALPSARRVDQSRRAEANADVVGDAA